MRERGASLNMTWGATASELVVTGYSVENEGIDVQERRREETHIES